MPDTYDEYATYATARTHAHSVTDSVSPEQRAAIEADVLRRMADRFQREWPVYGDDWLRAQADRIEEDARPTPEGDPR